MSKEIPSMPAKKPFRPKCALARIEDYRKRVGDSYWSDWPFVSWEEAKNRKSSIDPDRLEQLALQTNYPYKEVLQM